MRKLFWKAVVGAALISLVVALVLACGKPTVYSIEKIQYSDTHQCLGVMVHLDNDEVEDTVTDDLLDFIDSTLYKDGDEE